MRANDKDWNICKLDACKECWQLKPLIDETCVSCTDNKHIDELTKVIQMCFEDACKPSGKISKKTALELMKYADTRA